MLRKAYLKWIYIQTQLASDRVEDGLLRCLEEGSTSIYIPAILLRHRLGTRFGPEDTIIVSLLFHLILKVVIILARLNFL
jgi:hypothetical protein